MQKVIILKLSVMVLMLKVGAVKQKTQKETSHMYFQMLKEQALMLKVVVLKR
jgi:hypothetical protein